MVSRITLFGLNNQVDVIRRIATDDGAGGISSTASEVTVYSNKDCRITTIEPDDEMMKGYGYNAQQHRRAILPYLPQIQRDNDFLRVPFGVPPNLSTTLGIPDGASPVYTLTHPTGSVEMTWDSANTRWVDSGVTITLTFLTDTWTFNDTVNTQTDALIFAEDLNPWIHASFPWNSGTPDGYAIVTNSPIDYRVIWHKHQFDDFGQPHHTSVVIELEE